MANMRAVTIVRAGQVAVAERAQPRPREGEILVKVRAAGLNRVDLLQVNGRYPAPEGYAPDVPGLEFSGVVVESGPGAARFKPGDAVFGLFGGGGQAEFVAVKEDLCALVPSDLELVVAGGVPETFITVHDALFVQSSVRAGDEILVHAVGSGVGTSALTVGRALGCVVHGTGRKASKLARAKDLGLAEAIELPAGADPATLEEKMAPVNDRIQSVLDLVGGDYLAADLVAVKSRGYIVMISTQGGTTTTINLRRLMDKRVHLVGTVLRYRTETEKEDAIARFAADLGPLLGTTVKPVVDVVLPLADAAKAYELISSDKHFGKIILEMSE